MKVGVLGSGNVGQALGRGFVAKRGDEVTQVCEDFGWPVIDLGGIEASR